MAFIECPDCGARVGNFATHDCPKSQAKATKGKAGTAGVKGPVRRSTAGTGLRVGVAGAGLPATSEHMDVTAGETAPNSDGVGLMSIAHPPGLIDKMADAIRSGKLSLNRGRPRKPADADVSERTKFRRQAEQRDKSQ